MLLLSICGAVFMCKYIHCIIYLNTCYYYYYYLRIIRVINTMWSRPYFLTDDTPFNTDADSQTEILEIFIHFPKDFHRLPQGKEIKKMFYFVNKKKKIKTSHDGKENFKLFTKNVQK